MRILFVSGGRRTYLVQYALDLIPDVSGLEVWVSDVDSSTAALHVSPKVRWFLTPRVSDGDAAFAEYLLEACRERGIDIVVPLMDYVIPVLARAKGDFEAFGIKVWVSSPEVVDACLDKNQCAEFCASHGVLMPTSSSMLPTDPRSYPVFKKRICGSGSVGQALLQHPEEDVTGNASGTYMYQQFVAGEEYAMDIFNDYEGNYLHSCFRRKLLMRSGETDKAMTLYSERFEQLARAISSAFRHVGNMDVDFIVASDGIEYFLDFNPRFGGGYPFTHMAGVNYIRALIDISAGRAPTFPEKYDEIVGMKTIGLVHYPVASDVTPTAAT